MINLFNKPTVCYSSKSPCAWGGMNFISVALSRAVIGRRKNLLCSGLFGVDWPLDCGMPRLGVLILHLLKSKGFPAGFME